VQPNIVLISIDALRADHLSTYGYPRKTTPFISQLASDGVLFERAISQAPWTLPSMATLHTSLYPTQHGAIGATTRLRSSLPTLAEILRQHGYLTIGIVSAIFAGKKFGFAKGFDSFDESNALGPDAVTSPALTRLALRGFHSRRDGPVFLWVHYFDPHFAYVRHPEYRFAEGERGRFSDPVLTQEGEPGLPIASPINEDELAHLTTHLIRVYDEEIAFTDHWVGKLLAGIEHTDDPRPTLVILTADHGEYFLERGRFGHGIDVYEELIHVPLVVSGAVPPELRGVRVAAPVEVASVARTIMGIAGIAEQPFQGVDLLDVARGEPTPRYAYSAGSGAWVAGHRTFAVVAGKHKLIHRLASDSHELYDLEADPGERRNLFDAPELRSLRDELLPVLKAFALKVKSETEEISLSEEERERLRALGYGAE
jgi:arylsulfatase A-like enzyme